MISLLKVYSAAFSTDVKTLNSGLSPIKVIGDPGTALKVVPYLAKQLRCFPLNTIVFFPDNLLPESPILIAGIKVPSLEA